MSPRTVAILQSNYIPWKGYYDLISRSDVVVLYDEVQYTRRDWRNRNRIKTANGPRWLTIPLETKGHYHRSIRETRISSPGWGAAHWRKLEHAYRGTSHYAWAAERLAPLYADADEDYLSVSNRQFLEATCGWLGIDTPMRWSWELPGGEGDPTGRLLHLCRALDAERYLSGPAARAYLDEQRFVDAGISVDWMEYDRYPAYPQPHGEFVHAVSIVDLLFCTGPDAPAYIAQAR